MAASLPLLPLLFPSSSARAIAMALSVSSWALSTVLVTNGLKKSSLTCIARVR